MLRFFISLNFLISQGMHIATATDNNTMTNCLTARFLSNLVSMTKPITSSIHMLLIISLLADG